MTDVTTPSNVKTPSKKALLIALLERKNGATIDQMIKTTGWQAHSCRAALTGLRKAGYVIESEKDDKVRRYRITAVPEAHSAS